MNVYFFLYLPPEYMINEDLLHFIWKHRFLPLRELKTDSGQPLEIIDPGIFNSDAGPDFLNAKVKIDNTIWVGNIELHIKSEDWYVHGHDRNPVYDTVVLHVSLGGASQIINSKGEVIPQVFIDIPEYLQERYMNLKVSNELAPCRSVIPLIKPLVFRSWMERLLIERFEERSQRIQRYFISSQYSWNAVFFITLSRAFGFGKNSDAFEAWALNLPYSHLLKHVENQIELESIFLGTAGLLKTGGILERFMNKTPEGMRYFQSLQQAYSFLMHKYEMKEMDSTQWKYLRTRPYNFPHVRIIQLASIYREFCYKVTDILEGQFDFESCLRELKFLNTWESRCAVPGSGIFQLTDRSIQLLIMNCIIPLIYAMGKYKGEMDHMQMAADRICELKPESNHIVKLWETCGVAINHAGDSQAVIQLQREYCDKKKCLQCCFGMEYLRKK